MSIDVDVTASAESLPITAMLMHIAELHRDADGALPVPGCVRANKTLTQPQLEVTVATFAEMSAWADALQIPSNARHSYSYRDGSAIHSAWLVDLLGWHVRVTAAVDAPAHAEAPLGDAMAHFLPEHGEAVAS